jgi:hypothetical protein
MASNLAIIQQINLQLAAIFQLPYCILESKLSVTEKPAKVKGACNKRLLLHYIHFLHFFYTLFVFKVLSGFIKHQWNGSYQEAF